MPRAKRKPKTPITAANHRSKPAATAKKLSTTARINQFHALSRQLSLLAKQKSQRPDDSDAIDAEMEHVKAQIDDIGGLHAYQRASLKGGDERSGRGACGKWLVSKLKPILESPPSLWHSTPTTDSPNSQKLKLLDVGALNGETYAKQSKWIHAEYIDLNPQHPSVQRQDFFQRPVPELDADLFHVVCLSLVVNFVDDAEKRGEMLIHARKFLLPNGLLFLVLPLPCTANSRYMTHARLNEICNAIGFIEIEYHATKRLSYHVWRRVESTTRVQPVSKMLVNDGAGRNNFSIVVLKGLEMT